MNTPTTPKQTPNQIDDYLPAAKAQIDKLRQSVHSAVVGQTAIVDKLLACVLAGGHALLEGLPGLGKTLLVKALSRALSMQFGRVQFTPDLMPADALGHSVYDLRSGVWQTRKGPIFCNLLLADEINRAPAKTQAALLEAMQERQVTIEGVTYPLPEPFLCIATQNPLDQEGTYPLPEAQLDRFLLNLRMEYPSYDDEKRLLIAQTKNRVGDTLDVSQVRPVLDAKRLLALQQLAARVLVDDKTIDYVLGIVRQSRDFAGIEMGASSRAALALIRVAKAWALMQGRSFVVPEDVRVLSADVLRHRVRLSLDFRIDGRLVDEAIAALLAAQKAPRS